MTFLGERWDKKWCFLGISVLEYSQVTEKFQKPRVTVGLPVFNGENYLAEALDSLLTQSFENFLLIISDNASTDSTQKICTDYSAKDPRIRYVRLDTNVGAAENYNRLVDVAEGDYFKWAAHDDNCRPEFFTEMRRSARYNAGCSALLPINQCD